MLSLSSGVLLSASKRAVERDPPSADDPLVAILFAALGVEAWLNELLDAVRHEREGHLTPPLDGLQSLIEAARLEDRATSVLTRLQVVATVLTNKPLPLGQQPWQDFDLLFALRNFLAHQRPGRSLVDILEDDEGTLHVEQSKLAPIGERLVARKLVDRPPPKVITPAIALVQTPRVGQWAFETAGLVILAVADWLPSAGLRSRVLFGVEYLFTK